MSAAGLRAVLSLAVASVAALCLSIAPATAQSNQPRLVVFEGFYNPG
jgi:hypothetical protein